MKNITKLLLTSALVAGVSSVALADAPVITVGGKVESRIAFINQTTAYSNAATVNTLTSGNNGHAKMATSSKLNVKAEGRNDAGLVYGAFVELEDANLNTATSANNDQGDAARIRRSFVYFDSAMGRIELGNNDSASKSMKVDATDIARASGGIDGDMTSFINTATVGYMDVDNDGTAGVAGDEAQYLTSVNLLADESKSVRKYNKVTYYTPEISGFQFGLSYATDNQNRGGLDKLAARDFSTATMARNIQVGFTNVFSAGITYNFAMDNVSFKLGATGQYGKAKKNTDAAATATRDAYHNLRAYNFGGVVSYTNFSVAGSYGSNGKSANTKETDIFNSSSSRYYTVGGSYVQGPVGLSVTNFSSKRMTNKFDMLSVGADYELAKGALAYVEGNIFKLTPGKAQVKHLSGGTTPALKNSGSVILVGAKFAF